MENVYVLNKNLQVLGIVDNFQSLIWVRRYNTVGQCEVALAATLDNISLFTEGYYIIRPDDEMVCRVVKIEIDTAVDGKNTLIITGQDVAGLLNQRIMAGMRVCDGNVRTFIVQRIGNECIAAVDTNRNFKKADGTTLLSFGDVPDPNPFTEQSSDSMTYANLGEMVQKYCKTFQWGYKITWNRTTDKLQFDLYKGADRSGTVLFSPRFDNLASSKYVNDASKRGNSAVVSYITPWLGSYVNGDYGATPFTSTDRYEFFVSGDRVARQLKYSEVLDMFPTGQRYANNYQSPVRIQIFTAKQKQDLTDEYIDELHPSTTRYFETVDGTEYFVVADPDRITVATLQTDQYNPDDPAVLKPAIYDPYLYALGQEKMKDYGDKTTFEGAVIPNVTYRYKQDYFLGDIVKVENEYGITANARIVEVLECLNENGYTLEPKFEYLAG